MGVEAEFDQVIKSQIQKLRTDLQGVSSDQCASQTKFLLRYRNRANARNAIQQSRTYLCVETGQLDRRDDVIAVRNGLVTLKDGMLAPLSPEHYITKRLEVDFNPSAECPHFKKVLSDAFCGDEDLIAYFKGIMGYWLTGSAVRQEIYFLHGAGANGKSTLLNAIANVLGPYAGTLQSETIFEGLTGQHHYDLASVRACRLVIVHEAESKSKLNAARVKQLTGQDEVKARELYKAPISFKPKFKIAVICNKRPNLDAYDDALKRRIKLIPFEHVIPSDLRDPSLGEKLKAEASGILNFLIEGARMHFRNEIREPSAVRHATQTYLRDQDTVASFLEASTIEAFGATVGKGALYDAYANYCAEEAMQAVSKGEFGSILKKMNYEDTRKGDERQWKGLRLLLPNEGPE
ncbi:MAG: DNA primase family protein, partial [Terriglobia bacterium]